MPVTKLEALEVGTKNRLFLREPEVPTLGTDAAIFLEARQFADERRWHFGSPELVVDSAVPGARISYFIGMREGSAQELVNKGELKAIMYVYDNENKPTDNRALKFLYSRE